MNMICEPLVRFIVRSNLKFYSPSPVLCVFIAVLNKDVLQREACLEAAVQTHLLCSLYRGFCGSASETQVDPRKHGQHLTLIHTYYRDKKNV